jgi:hypothetical protein
MAKIHLKCLKGLTSVLKIEIAVFAQELKAFCSACSIKNDIVEECKPFSSLLSVFPATAMLLLSNGQKD